MTVGVVLTVVVLLAADVGAEGVGEPHGKVKGLLQFRGNPTHTWYGEGPLPKNPKVLWRFPRGDETLCAVSLIGKREKEWCGSGWTGQPVVYERADGKTEVIVGAFDRKVHFLDADTGKRLRPDFPTADIIKGSVTLDPDGFPLIYFGSRDNRLRVVALDGPRPRQVWVLKASQFPGLYDNDWDGNPSIIDDVMYEGGENGWLFAVRLNRGWAADGQHVVVAPEIQVAFKGWTDELVHTLHDRNSSIESSVAVTGGRVYYTNGQGRVVGLDVSKLAVQKQGPLEPAVVFDTWLGDDADASPVVDADGALYVGTEDERHNERSRTVGNLVKLDPKKSGDPVVWSIKLPSVPGARENNGLWSTPALGKGVLYAASAEGRFMAIETDSGKIVWEEALTEHTWSSPVVVGDELLMATCHGDLRAYSVADPKAPKLLWSFRIGHGRCIESTPAVWHGRIFVGSWDGHIYAVGSEPAAE